MHIWLCIASSFHILFHTSVMILQRWLCIIRPNTCNYQYLKLFGHRMNEVKQLLICLLSKCKLRVFSGSLRVQNISHASTGDRQSLPMWTSYALCRFVAGFPAKCCEIFPSHKERFRPSVFHIDILILGLHI